MNNKNLFKKTLEKAVSQLQMESDEGAEDCECSWGTLNDDFDFVIDCALSDNAKISNVTESFCTKEPEVDGLFMQCKGRCKRVYTCTRSGPDVDPSKRVTTKTIYGKCVNPDPVIGPGVVPTPSKPNLETR